MIRAILTDIEGTTSSLSFVKDVLFPYARERMAEFVRQHAQEAGVRKELDEVRRLSGKSAEFHTAVSLLDAKSGQIQSRVVPCRVTFRRLDDRQIEAYLQREQPYDCAASAKSEGLGIALIARIETEDPTSLIGLPLIALSEMLERAGLPVV